MAGSLSGDAARIALLVSDVDGTLVTGDKRLTSGNVAAAARLADAGVKLALVSSRPPIGFAMLIDPLDLKAPVGAFNGGALLNPDLTVIEATAVPREAAATALKAFEDFGLDAWVFTNDAWYVARDTGTYIPKERRTLQHEPEVVDAFDFALDAVGKLVGSSENFERVTACEAALAERLGTRATAKRSQNYYLDVTPFGFDKGAAVRRIAAMLDIPMREVAVIGDMANDIAMFEVAGSRIAMGNGIDELKRLADFVTEDNEHDGFAVAVDRFILDRARPKGAA